MTKPVSPSDEAVALDVLREAGVDVQSMDDLRHRMRLIEWLREECTRYHRSALLLQQALKEHPAGYPSEYPAGMDALDSFPMPADEPTLAKPNGYANSPTIAEIWANQGDENG